MYIKQPFSSIMPVIKSDYDFKMSRHEQPRHKNSKPGGQNAPNLNLKHFNAQSNWPNHKSHVDARTKKPKILT